VHLLEDVRNALCTDIESTVRAVGKIVVCVEAAAEERTIKSRRWSRIEPTSNDRRSPTEDGKYVIRMVGLPRRCRDCDAGE